MQLRSPATPAWAFAESFPGSDRLDEGIEPPTNGF
jgi:hypothetical protein